MLMVGEAERRRRFGYALQEALKARGMSERQLSIRLAIDARKIAKWRTGGALPDLYQTQALVEALQVSEELFRNPPEVPEPPAYPIERYLIGGGEDSLDPAEEQVADSVVDEALAERRNVAGSGRRNGDRTPPESGPRRGQ